MTDYGNLLLKAVNQADKAGNKQAYALRRDAYLNLILDLDELLNTNQHFMLGRWTKMARAIADEASGTTKADRDWLELNNARTLITTWGERTQSENGGLRDYSYRMWGGMMKDFYYNRWRLFFDNRDKGTPSPDWFDHDWKWAHDASVQYNDTPVGETAKVAERLFTKYFINISRPSGTTYHAYRYLTTDARAEVSDVAVRGERYTFPVDALPEGISAKVGVDLNGDGMITTDEEAEGLTINIPAEAVTGKVTARLTLSDGTVFEYSLTQKDVISRPRTVSVATADETQGLVAIDGVNELSVTGTDEVTLRATARPGYDFLHWTDAAGNIVSTANPYTYYGAPNATFTAHFIVNKWGVPEEDRSEIGVVESTGQYLTELNVSMNGGKELPYIQLMPAQLRFVKVPISLTHRAEAFSNCIGKTTEV